MKMTDSEKLILIMLCDLHEHLKIDGSVDPALVREAIHSGNAWGLKWQYPGIFDAEEPTEDLVNEVGEILSMWELLEASHEDLSAADKDRVKAEADPFGDPVRFPGFDGNNECEYLNVARFLVEKMDRFAEFKGRINNSHMPTLGGYRRMLAALGPIRDGLHGNLLGAAQVIAVLNARRHPKA